MKCACVILLIIYFSGIWRLSRATCVLESDFGFVLNCAFKKSGLFRVRNLGGIKAHIGLGFSVGDELGFKESISNVEINRRRSAQASRFQAALAQAQAQAQQSNVSGIKVRSPMLPEVPPVPAASSPHTTVPPFKPIPPAPERPSIPTISIVNTTKLKPTKSDVPMPSLVGIVPQPSSISRLSSGPTVPVYSPKDNVIAVMVPVTKNKIADKMNGNNFALRTLSSPNNELPPPLPQTNSNSVNAILAAVNVSDEALEAEFSKGQKYSTTTRKPSPLSHKHSSSYGKVMNAPKEYYPVGYDKNFDDNFASRVELPETSFYCGDQKHFPGLYADEDLGCMVFHVCALTDDGLIMKSFLCPESTLFDQTILKCNWWFYVDCKSSKKLYDSNIPISKSYQLMKALTFFSAYKNEAAQQPPKTTDKD